MSSSIAAAKRRRGVIDTTPPPPPPQQQQQQMSGSAPSATGLTLQQVVKVVDKRLINLELFMKETIDLRGSSQNGGGGIQGSSSSSQPLLSTQIETIDAEGKVTNMTIKDMLEDFDKKYELLAEEVITLKNIVLELQSFTMSVNKKMFDKLNDSTTQNTSDAANVTREEETFIIEGGEPETNEILGIGMSGLSLNNM